MVTMKKFLDLEIMKDEAGLYARTQNSGDEHHHIGLCECRFLYRLEAGEPIRMLKQRVRSRKKTTAFEVRSRGRAQGPKG